MVLAKKTFIAIYITIALSVLAAVILLERKNSEKRITQWHEYFEQEHNSRIYLNNQKEDISIVVCTCIAGIECSIHLNHSCTEEQFSAIQNMLKQNGIEYRGIAEQPDTEGFPDLTDYLPLVMSSDEMHEMWRQLGLE